MARACSVRETAKNDQVRSIAASLGTLPSTPELYVQLTRAASSEAANAQDIGRIIARDPAVCAKVLQLVNSSFFGLGRRVSSVEQAVSLLGIIRMKSLVLSSQITEEFRPARQVPGFSAKRLLERSMLTAEYAQAISRAEGQDRERQDQAFAAGLLHDVGLLVLAARKVDVLEEALAKTIAEGIAYCDAERSLLGGTHADISACLLELWNLPPRLVEGVSLHHTPGRCGFDGVSAVTAVHSGAALLGEVLAGDPDTASDCVFAPQHDLIYLQKIGRAHRVEAWRKLVPAAATAKREKVCP